MIYNVRIERHSFHAPSISKWTEIVTSDFSSFSSSCQAVK